MIELKDVLSVEESLNGNLNLGVDYYKGDKGEKGDTPIKGKDYFTQEEIEKVEQDTIDKISLDGFAKKADLADVATSGSYKDLKDKPEPIDLTPYPTKNEVEQSYAKKTEIPTNVSAFTNDAGYLTEHQSLADYALKSEIPDTTNLATKDEVQEVENKIPEPYTLPMATTSTLGGVKPDGTTITVADGVISAVGGSGSGGGANADEETIITNAEGKLETVIGGKYVPAMVDGPVIVNLDPAYDQGGELGPYLTYDIMQELISKGDRLRASLSSGFGEETGCLVDIDTSITDTYKLTCKYTITSVKVVYTGIGTKDNWKCSRQFDGGSSGFNSTGNYFYSLVEGKKLSPIKVEAIPFQGPILKAKNDKLTINPILFNAGNNYVTIGYSEGSQAKADRGGVCIGHWSSCGGDGFVVGNNNSAGYKGVNIQGVWSSGDYSVAIGGSGNSINPDKKYNIIIGGEGLKTEKSNHQQVFGKYNTIDNNSQYIHVVGNGTSDSARSNAYTLDWSGNGTFAGTVSSSTGADYAEYFEWKDGNPNNEDRVGYIVCLDGDKIVKANTGDDILGICSGTAMVLGDSGEWNWNKRYLTDDFGRIIYEDRIEHYEAIYSPDGELIKDAWDEEVYAPKQNPDYDSSKPYIKRADRPEWQIVGMMGKLYVRDDGACVVNGYADVKDGIATKATGKTNMRVMERVNDSIIRVLMK